MAVTSNMLEVVPSPGGVSITYLLSSKSDAQPGPANPYGPPPDVSPDDQEIINNRDPELGLPVGKNEIATPPILLAKLSRGQEIELTCKAYKACLSVSLEGDTDSSRA